MINQNIRLRKSADNLQNVVVYRFLPIFHLQNLVVFTIFPFFHWNFLYC